MSVGLNKKEILRYKKGTKNEQNEPATTYHLVFEHEGWLHEARGYIAQGMGQELEALAWRLEVASIPREEVREEA
jgi:hypothetical protein